MLTLFNEILNADKLSLSDFLLQNKQLTRERFGNTIHLFAPLYLSNECQNICTYCGFSVHHKIKRKTLSETEIINEIKTLKSFGFDAVLLVTGEDYRIDIKYILNAVNLIKPYISQIAVEVQPLSTDEYLLLKQAGIYSVVVYQETYDRTTYQEVHPKGKKSNYDFRYNTPNRIASSGINKIGIGILLGLAPDWRADAIALAEHLSQLQKQFWQTKFSISFPRIRPFEGEYNPKCLTTELDLLKLFTAFRLCFPDVEIILSTRERSEFRDIAINYGITSMSAGSKTAPGAYSNTQEKTLQQFETNDERTPYEIVKLLSNNQIEPIWKDWDLVLT